jgi:hypothetical protein
MSFLKNLTDFINESNEQHTRKMDDKSRWNDICVAHKNMFLTKGYSPPKLLPEYLLNDLLTFSKDTFKPEYPFIDAINIFENERWYVNSTLTVPIEIELSFYIKKIPLIWHQNKFNLSSSIEFKNALINLKKNLLSWIDTENLIDNTNLNFEIEIFGADMVQVITKIFLNIYYSFEYGDFPEKYTITNDDTVEYGHDLINHVTNLSIIEILRISGNSKILLDSTHQSLDASSSKFGTDIEALIKKLACQRFSQKLNW